MGGFGGVPEDWPGGTFQKNHCLCARGFNLYLEEISVLPVSAYNNSINFTL